MQNLNWNDLRYLLAVARGRTLSGAARILGVDDTTVSRRLTALRRTLGDELCLRQADGVLVLTDAGAAIAGHAERMEREADFIGEVVGGDQTGCSGTVRVTSVPFLINRWLVPRLGDLLGSYPKLQIELVPDSRDVNLDLREADIALRFARPTTGGSKIICRRITSFAFGVYAARRLPATKAGRLPWIGYEDAWHICRKHDGSIRGRSRTGEDSPVCASTISKRRSKRWLRVSGDPCCRCRLPRTTNRSGVSIQELKRFRERSGCSRIVNGCRSAG